LVVVVVAALVAQQTGQTAALPLLVLFQWLVAAVVAAQEAVG
jgi:hypothetical protein